MGLIGGRWGAGAVPPRKWVRDPLFRHDVDLDRGTLGGVRLGLRPESLAALGPPAEADPADEGAWSWPDLGFAARGRKGLTTAFEFALETFSGRFHRSGAPCDLFAGLGHAGASRLLGEPWHRYADPDRPDAPLELFYYPARGIELVLEIGADDRVRLLTLVSPPRLSDPAERRALRAARPWPPVTK